MQYRHDALAVQCSMVLPARAALVQLNIRKVRAGIAMLRFYLIIIKKYRNSQP